MDGSTRARRRVPAGVQPVLALDIGGTKLAAAVVTADGAARGVVVEPTRREDGWSAVLERLFAMGRQAVEAAGSGAIAAVGIACGGPLDSSTGVLIDPPHRKSCLRFSTWIRKSTLRKTR
jgi:glucokinase